MFHILHKIAVGMVCLIWVGIAVVIFQNRDLFYPAADFVKALWIRKDGVPTTSVQVSGKVVRVIDAASFQMKGEPGFFSIRLTGLEFPSEGSRAKEDLALWREGKTNLSRLILSNHVRVVFTYLAENRAGLGTVYLGTTNVNAEVVASGVARPKREFLKSLTIGQIYDLVRAERKAKEQQTGIWANPAELQLTSSAITADK